MTSVLFFITCAAVKMNCYPEFAKYIDVFEQGTHHRVHTDISFGEVSHKDWNGECKNGKIIINPKRWELFDDTLREVLILHELGHCELNLNHTNHGIMRHEIISGNEYLQNKEKFLNEFFNSRGAM